MKEFRIETFAELFSKESCWTEYADIREEDVDGFKIFFSLLMAETPKDIGNISIETVLACLDQIPEYAQYIMILKNLPERLTANFFSARSMPMRHVL